MPDDISLISFDDQQYSALLSTPMTTIMQQTEEMGKIAMKIMLKQLNQEDSDQDVQIFLPTKLIKRKSVKNLNKNIIGTSIEPIIETENTI